MIWEKVEIDIIYISWIIKEDKVEFIVFIKDNLNEWIEKYIIKIMNFKNVTKFIYKNIIYRYEYF